MSDSHHNYYNQTIDACVSNIHPPLWMCAKQFCSHPVRMFVPEYMFGGGVLPSMEGEDCASVEIDSEEEIPEHVLVGSI